MFLGQGSIRYKVCCSLSESGYKRILRGICFCVFELRCMRDKLGSSSKRGIEYECFETNWGVM